MPNWLIDILIYLILRNLKDGVERFSDDDAIRPFDRLAQSPAPEPNWKLIKCLKSTEFLQHSQLQPLTLDRN